MKLNFELWYVPDISTIDCYNLHTFHINKLDIFA